jgi:hypothetical protein
MAKPISMIHTGLDGKKLFYLLYKEMGRGGTLDKVAEHMYNRGIYNTEIGKPYSTSAIFQSIWRWLLYNLDEAKPVYKNYILLFGEDFDEDLWKAIIAQRAEIYLTPAQARRFFVEHPEYRTK